MDLQLNAAQREAIQHIHSPLLVIAGAGSGKTRVITHKIAHLIHENHFKAKQIAAITFTNKAAREMQHRVQSLVKAPLNKGLTVCTFHALGLEIVKQGYRHLGLKSKFSLFDTEDSLNLLAQCAEKKMMEHAEQLKKTLTQISMWKNALIAPEALIRETTDEQLYRSALSYQSYQERLQLYNAVDFDDLIRLPNILFVEHPQELLKWQGKLHYLLVDEYQDTNLSQFSLIKHLCGIRQQFTLVGDDDQAIYAWRGAEPKLLQQIQHDFPTLKVVKLEQNYRSKQTILNASNYLIDHNAHIFSKKLWSQHQQGEKVRIIKIDNDTLEARSIIDHIIQHKLQTGSPLHDYAILYRSNHQARPFEQTLREANLPYNLSGSTSDFMKTEIKDLAAYLRLMLNPEDDNAFLRCINTPKRELGPKTIEKLTHYAHQREISLLSACLEMGLTQVLPTKTTDVLHEFAHTLMQTADNLSRSDPIECLQSYINALNYDAHLLENSTSVKQAEKRMENVNHFLNWLYRLLKGTPDSKALTFEKAMHRMMLIDILDAQNKNNEEGSLVLSTLHAAKGLEFPYVYLIGLEEGILPHENSIASDTIEEERRLMYVGMTRAQDELTISWCEKRKKQGGWYTTEMSRFLSELPESETIRPDSLSVKSPLVNESLHGHSCFNALKAMLSQEE